MMDVKGSLKDTDTKSKESQAVLGKASSNMTHPLQQQLVLINIFKHLQADPSTLKNCRETCKQWNAAINTSECQIPILISGNINRFNELKSHPGALLICQNVILGPEVNADDAATILFLETHGHEVKKIKIESEIDYFHSLYLPELCNNLTHLDINPNITSVLEIPTMLRKTWKNPFPQLRSLTMTIRSINMEYPYLPYHHNDPQNYTTYITNVANFLILILRKALKVTQLTLLQLGTRVWNQIANQIAERPHINQRLSQIHLNILQLTRNDNLGSLCIGHQLKLTNLQIKGVVALQIKQFSKVLKNFSETLEVLEMNVNEIKGYSEATGLEYTTFQLHLPCVMTKLRRIKFYIRGETRISCSGPEGSNILEKLPNLEVFHKEEATHLPSHRYRREVCWTTFWNDLIPTGRTPNSNFVHNKLKEFTSNVTFLTNKAKQFKRLFPQLRKCSVRIKGEVFKEFVSELVNCQIEELDVMYYETAEGFDEFASAISGIRVRDCEQYWELGGQVNKVRGSLADWRNLKNLRVYYIPSHAYGPDLCVPLTRVSIERGFGTIKNLKKLELLYFEIHPKQIRTMLTNVPLEIFDLRQSRVNFWDDPNQHVPTAVTLIQENFPRTQLLWQQGFQN